MRNPRLAINRLAINCSDAFPRSGIQLVGRAEKPDNQEAGGASISGLISSIPRYALQIPVGAGLQASRGVGTCADLGLANKRSRAAFPPTGMGFGRLEWLATTRRVDHVANARGTCYCLPNGRHKRQGHPAALTLDTLVKPKSLSTVSWLTRRNSTPKDNKTLRSGALSAGGRSDSLF